MVGFPEERTCAGSDFGLDTMKFGRLLIGNWRNEHARHLIGSARQEVIWSGA